MPSFVTSYVRRGILINLFIGLLFLFFVKNPKVYIMGIIFGGSVSVLMFIALYRSTVKMVDKDPEGGKRYVMMQYFFRMCLYATVLVVAALADYISLYTTFIGLLSVKIAIYSDSIRKLLQERR